MRKNCHRTRASASASATIAALLLAACTAVETPATRDAEPAITLQPQVNLPNCAEETDSDALNVFCLFNSAVLLRNAGYQDRAKLEFQRVLAVDERHLLAHQYLGDIYFEEGDLALAEAMYLAVTELDPTSAIIHRNLGVIYDRNGETAKAIASYSESIRLNPASAESHYNLGIAYSRDRATMDEAIAAFQQAIALNPSGARYHYDLGRIYDYLADDRRAETHYQKAAELGYSP